MRVKCHLLRESCGVLKCDRWHFVHWCWAFKSNMKLTMCVLKELRVRVGRDSTYCDFCNKARLLGLFFNVVFNWTYRWWRGDAIAMWSWGICTVTRSERCVELEEWSMVLSSFSTTTVTLQTKLLHRWLLNWWVTFGFGLLSLGKCSNRHVRFKVVTRQFIIRPCPE